MFHVITVVSVFKVIQHLKKEGRQKRMCHNDTSVQNKFRMYTSLTGFFSCIRCWLGPSDKFLGGGLSLRVTTIFVLQKPYIEAQGIISLIQLSVLNCMSLSPCLF